MPHRLNSGSTSLAFSSQYTLQRRLVLPRWWVVGTLFRLNRALIDTVSDSPYVCAPEALPPEDFLAMCRVWNALIRKAQSGEDGLRQQKVILNAEEHGFSSASQLHAVASLQSQMLMPVSIYEKIGAPLRSRQRKAGSFRRIESLSLFSRCKLLKDGGLELEAQVPLAEVLTGEFICSALSSGSSRSFALGRNQNLKRHVAQFVSLSPSLLLSLRKGSKSSLKKLVLYLWLEVAKFQASPAEGEESRESLLAHDLPLGLATEFAGDLMMRAALLYDHGVLSWGNELPVGRIRLLRESRGCADGGVLQMVRLSPVNVDTLAFEENLSAVFDSLSREKSWQQRDVLEEADRAQVVPRPLLAQESLFGGSEAKSEVASARDTGKVEESGRRLSSLKKMRRRGSSGWQGVQHDRMQTAQVDSVLVCDEDLLDGESQSPEMSFDEELDYALKLAQYYESLTPRQRLSLDQEMRNKSPIEVKRFIFRQIQELMRH